MDRREAIKKTVLLTGAALSASTITAILQGCQPDPTSMLDWQPAFFTTDQATLLAEVAETILPATDTPGAKDIGVPAFIDQLTASCFTEEEQGVLVSGLNEITEKAQQTYKQSFNDLSTADRLTLLNAIDKDAQQKEKENPKERDKEYSGFLRLKQLVLLGYFTSEKIGTEVTAFQPIPGQYKPCIPYEEGQPAWTY